MSCEGRRSVAAVSQFSSVEFRYWENYNLVVIARLEFRGSIVCLRVTTRYLRMVIWMVRFVGRSKEDKFSIEYSMEHTWPCITLDYKKKSPGFFMLLIAQRGGNIFCSRQILWWTNAIRYSFPREASWIQRTFYRRTQQSFFLLH